MEEETSLVTGRTSAFGLKEVWAMEEEMINERRDKKMENLTEATIGTDIRETEGREKYGY